MPVSAYRCVHWWISLPLSCYSHLRIGPSSDLNLMSVGFSGFFPLPVGIFQCYIQYLHPVVILKHSVHIDHTYSSYLFPTRLLTSEDECKWF